MLGVVNFAHGAFYMLGAFGAYVLLDATRRRLLGRCWSSGADVLGCRRRCWNGCSSSWLPRLDPLYNFLLTFGLTLVLVRTWSSGEYGVRPLPYRAAGRAAGTVDLGLFACPAYQVFVLGVLGRRSACAVWLLLTRTRVGMIVRASTERPELTRALGIDVGRWVTPVFGFGIALAGLAGVLRRADAGGQRRLMGTDLIIILFAVVVIGGLGSIFGAVVGRLPRRPASRRCGRLLRPAVLPDPDLRPDGRGALWSGPAGLFGREEAA